MKSFIFVMEEIFYFEEEQCLLHADWDNVIGQNSLCHRQQYRRDNLRVVCLRVRVCAMSQNELVQMKANVGSQLICESQ